MLVPAVGLVFFAVMSKPAAAADNCFDYCQQAGGAGSCATRCSPGGDLDVTHPWHRSVFYGAIAYGAQSAANGYAYDKGSKSDADRSALSFCKQHGDDCKIVASFSNSCAAVAAVDSKGVYAVGLAGTRDDAQSKAMSACTAQNGGGCEIEAWTCALPK